MKLTAIKKLREELKKYKYKCKEGCFECCTAVPILEEERKEIEKELRRQGYTEPPNGKGDGFCEMLTPDGKCSVYNVRPIICRSFSGTKFKIKKGEREQMTPSCTYGDGHIENASPLLLKYGLEVLEKGLIIGSLELIKLGNTSEGKNILQKKQEIK